jgi:hypothetical protein
MNKRFRRGVSRPELSSTDLDAQLKLFRRRFRRWQKLREAGLVPSLHSASQEFFNRVAAEQARKERRRKLSR